MLRPVRRTKRRWAAKLVQTDTLRSSARKSGGPHLHVDAHGGRAVLQAAVNEAPHACT